MSDAGESPLADVRPGNVEPAEVDVSEIREAFDSADPLVRQRASRACETLVTEDVEAVRPLVTDLGSHLHDDSTAVVRTALSALTDLAARDPSALESCLGDLVAVVEADLNGVRLDGARCLGALAAERPDVCVPHVRRLVEEVVSRDGLDGVDASPDTVADPATRQTIRDHQIAERRDGQAARALLANVVAATAEAVPAALHDETASFVELLSVDDPLVVCAGLTALAAVARDDPSALTPTGTGDVSVEEALVDCLEHDARPVRARAIETFGFLGTESAVPILRYAAEADPDEDVAALARETAAFLES